MLLFSSIIDLKKLKKIFKRFMIYFSYIENFNNYMKKLHKRVILPEDRI